MKRMIFNTKKNIVFVILWIILSGMLWKNFDIGEYEQYAKTSLEQSTIGYNIEAENGYILNVIDNMEIDEVDKMTLRVYRNTYSNEYYQMALKVEKKCDIDKLKIIINDNLYNLKDLLTTEDNEYYYFVVGENTLTANMDVYSISLAVDRLDASAFLNQDYSIDFVELSSMKL